MSKKDQKKVVVEKDKQQRKTVGSETPKQIKKDTEKTNVNENFKIKGQKPLLNDKLTNNSGKNEPQKIKWKKIERPLMAKEQVNTNAEKIKVIKKKENLKINDKLSLKKTTETLAKKQKKPPKIKWEKVDQSLQAKKTVLLDSQEETKNKQKITPIKPLSDAQLAKIEKESAEKKALRALFLRFPDYHKKLGYLFDLGIPYEAEEEMEFPEYFSARQIKKFKAKAEAAKKRPTKKLKVTWSQIGDDFLGTFYRMRKAHESLEEAKDIVDELTPVPGDDVKLFHYLRTSSGISLLRKWLIHYPDQMTFFVKKMGYFIVEARLNTAKKRVKFYTKAVRVLEERYLKKFAHIASQEDLKEFLYEMYEVNKDKLPRYFPRRYRWWRDPERYWDRKYRLWWTGYWPDLMSESYIKAEKERSDQRMVKMYPESHPIPIYIRNWKKLLAEQREIRELEYEKLRAQGKDIPPLNASARKWEEGYLKLLASENSATTVQTDLKDNIDSSGVDVTGTISTNQQEQPVSEALIEKKQENSIKKKK